MQEKFEIPQEDQALVRCVDGQLQTNKETQLPPYPIELYHKLHYKTKWIMTSHELNM